MRASSPTRPRQDLRCERIRTQVPGRAAGAEGHHGRCRRLPREGAPERCRRATPLLVSGRSSLSRADGHRCCSSWTEDWDYVGVSVGVPAPVKDGRVVPVSPSTSGKGWAGLPTSRPRSASRRRSINDAAMQALGSYEGRRYALPRARHRPGYDDDPRRRHRADGARFTFRTSETRPSRTTWVRPALETRLGHKRWRERPCSSTIEQLSGRPSARLRRARRRQRP